MYQLEIEEQLKSISSYRDQHQCSLFETLYTLSNDNTINIGEVLASDTELFNEVLDTPATKEQQLFFLKYSYHNETNGAAILGLYENYFFKDIDSKEIFNKFKTLDTWECADAVLKMIMKNPYLIRTEYQLSDFLKLQIDNRSNCKDNYLNEQFKENILELLNSCILIQTDNVLKDFPELNNYIEFKKYEQQLNFY